ncbi:MAG TPA: type I glyceraldehyde-3-phosphate dehydrogenase [Actinomycetota bacterium]|nr:type I glyceraldehyde-3-phosphate dehydrogenase [Actinomycetota bacterium]
MTLRIGINGFGRIGRQILRRVLALGDEIAVPVINSRGAAPELAAHLFKYDSVFGRFPGECHADGEDLIVNGRSIRITAHEDPVLCPWQAFEVDVVLEATGGFTTRDAAAAHLHAGAQKVIITAPAKDEDLTVVVGVNDSAYDPEQHHVISAASCTTNCLAPVLFVLHEYFGVKSGLMTTIHSFTRDQELLDGTHSDLRRARAATLNMTPTKTGAAKAIDKVFPELAGRIVGCAVRVPLPDVSLLDLVVVLNDPPEVQRANEAFQEAAQGRMKGILDVTSEPLVSSDFHGDVHSAVVDLASTMKAPSGCLKVLAWYDNEAGYAARVVDLARMIGERLPRMAAGTHGEGGSGEPKLAEING